MPSFYFASTYGSGSYSTGSYQADSATSTGSTSGTATGTTGGATLANTGFDLLLAATLGSVIVFSALIIRFWKKSAKSQPSKGSD